MLDAFYQSIVIFFISYGVYNDMDVGLWQCGTTVITASLFVMCLHLAIETKSWVRLLLSFYSTFFFYITLLISFRRLCIGLQWCYRFSFSLHLSWFTTAFASLVLVCKIHFG